MSDHDETRPGGAGAPSPAPILVVDDDPEIRQMLRWALEDDGLRVETVADGLQAVDTLAQRRPALLILDMGLPGLDGYGVAEVVQATHGAAVPIIVVTADGHAATKARRVGAFAYLAKPFELDQLLSAVHRGLGNS